MSKTSRRSSRAGITAPGSTGQGTTTTGSHGPTGAPRVGRRERPRTGYQRSFLQRHGGTVIGLAVVVAAVAVVGFLFLSSTQKLYACSTLWQPPASGAPGTVGRLGAPQDDMGNHHVAVGESVRYTFCPPASGNHYGEPGGPIAAHFYGPDETVRPEGWIHNLEHGGIVILYRCQNGTCPQNDLATLRQLVATFPPSPICGLPAGNTAPVVARFDDMAKPFAAIVWDRVLMQDTLDTEQILQFYKTEDERSNPEPQCAPSPSPQPSASPSAGPSVAPFPSPSLSPSSSPSPSPS